MRVVALLLALVLSAGCGALKAKPSALAQHLSLAASVGCEAADATTTMYWRGYSQGQLHALATVNRLPVKRIVELNPLLKPFQDQPIWFASVKGGIAYASNVVTWLSQEDAPRLAFWGKVGNAALKCVLAKRNDNGARVAFGRP